MSVSVARTNVSNLVFHLYGRSVHPELFDVYAEREITQPAYSVAIRICDAGHMVSFRYRNQTVTEITTTHEHSLPQRKRHLEKRIRGHRDESFRFEDGLLYQVSYQLEQLEPEVFLNFHEELIRDCDRADVAFRFAAGSRLSPDPLSLIRADADTKSLLIHAFHTFPECHAIVKTQSLFEL